MSSTVKFFPAAWCKKISFVALLLLNSLNFKFVSIMFIIIPPLNKKSKPKLTYVYILLICTLNSNLPKFESGVFIHTVSEYESANSVIWATPNDIHPGAKHLCINGIYGDRGGGGNRLLNYIYNQKSYALIIYEMVAGESLNIAYVAIM